jgi:hypothetical protein
MDIMVAQVENGAAWELRDLLGRSMGTVTQVGSGFIIIPGGGALNSMEGVFLGPHRTLDAALAEIEVRTRGVCRRIDWRGALRRVQAPITERSGAGSALRARKIDMADREIRAALNRHWAASDANDFVTEHLIYRADAVLEYPQSGERIRGRGHIQSSRAAQPNRKRFTVRRITGTGDLWVTEYVLNYDGRPSFTVSIMEFRNGKVARETQYFGDPFEPGVSRAQWVEQISW